MLEMPSHLKINQAGGKVSATAGLLAPNIEKSLPTSFCQKKLSPGRKGKEGGGKEKIEDKKNEFKNMSLYVSFFSLNNSPFCVQAWYMCGREAIGQ